MVTSIIEFPLLSSTFCDICHYSRAEFSIFFFPIINPLRNLLKLLIASRVFTTTHILYNLFMYYMHIFALYVKSKFFFLSNFTYWEMISPPLRKHALAVWFFMWHITLSSTMTASLLIAASEEQWTLNFGNYTLDWRMEMGFEIMNVFILDPGLTELWALRRRSC